MKFICMYVIEFIYFVVIFDFVSFYGYLEFDFVIVQMFGGFLIVFFEYYYKVIFRVVGFRKRLDLYKFFYYFNYWLVVYYIVING